MADSRTVLVGGEKLQAALRRAGAAGPKLAGSALYREGERVMTRSKREFVPVDMGVLRASGHVQAPKADTLGVVVTLGYGGAAQRYALYVHEGTGPAVGRAPFMLPPEALRGWARRHGIPEDALYPLARAIGRRGLRPLKYLEKPLLEAVPGMDARLAADVRRGVKALAAR